MKTLIAVFATVGLASSLFAQGTIILANNVTGSLKAPVYAPQVGSPTVSLTGNTTAGLPVGSQTYTGALLSGAGFLGQLFSATGNNVASSSLAASTTAPVTFRTGGAAGFVPTTTVTLSNVAKDAPAATVQLRAWDNTSGLYSTWALAFPAWQSGLIAAGMSTTFNVAAIGGDLTTPPNLTGLTSFNIYTVVPEPTTMALAGLGGAALLLFRRRK